MAQFHRPLRRANRRALDKYIGGTARLGLKAAVITGVGDEHMGRFIREELAREGVDTRGVKTDPERLTALVILGIRDQEHFPLIFYRENCADMGLTIDDIDPNFITEARHCCNWHASEQPASRSRNHKGPDHCARKQHANCARHRLSPEPLGHGDGVSRFVESAKVTAKLQSTLHFFDLIVGTEEEFHIAGGSTDAIAALKAVRAVSKATLVCKRGAAGGGRVYWQHPRQSR